MPKSIVIAGSLAQRPHAGGHAWVFLQYLLGFRRLGFDVLFLDRLDPEMCRDADGRPCAAEDSDGLWYLAEVMRRFGFGESFAVACVSGGVPPLTASASSSAASFLGLPRRHVLERVTGSVLLLNVMGFCNDEEILAAAPMKAFLDIDPGFGQMWQDLGQADLIRGHDRYVTVGRNVGAADCPIPTCGVDWVTTPPPVVLEQWPVSEADSAGPFTSVVSWRGPFGPIEYKGRTFGLRAHEFRKFVDLPARTGRRFELALDIHPDETRDLALLDANGWARVDPRSAAGDPWSYRDYIRHSAAEFMVAKNLYVQTGGGWFSDRSVCYLASGRPVLAQDTGVRELYPVGEGLIAFATVDEAAEGVRRITGEYDRHARAARAVAEECFDSDKVLGSLLGKLGVN